MNNSNDSNENNEDNTLFLTFRLIKNFEYRNIKLLLLKLNPSVTIKEVKELIQNEIQTQSKFRAIKTHQFDSLKIYYKPHGMKPNCLAINYNTDDDFLDDDDKTLGEYNIESESEISYFNMEDFLVFKENPEVKF
eukprot:TRINITY_DN7201_c0_g1_i1.p1 TRINITY_DN7201_c0_g1~~TRINITY_DN7201_c0_g1_i1.p1  ORF type:complete len:135 (-),score=36.38 TRINITY_DN7201_c0_g1_i1:95-499(-)